MTAFAGLALLLSGPGDVGGALLGDDGCPRSSAPESQSGTTLKQFADATAGGVIYDDSLALLRLKREGGSFSASDFSISGKVQYACAGDFNDDGWVDFIGAQADLKKIFFYRNRTAENLALYPPDWTNPAYILPPKFDQIEFWSSSTTVNGGGAAACADFNGDGKMDFALVSENGDNGGNADFAKLFVGNGNGTFKAPTDLTSNPGPDFKDLAWDGNMWAEDYNNDGHKDLFFGADDSGGGYVGIYLNNGSATATKFVKIGNLISNANMGGNGIQSMVYLDVTGDGIKDLMVGGRGKQYIKLYPGLSGGGVASSAQVINTPTNAALLVASDFSLDGRPDIFFASDGDNGKVYYAVNNGTGTPFNGVTFKSIPEPLGDYDTGFLFNYDNDPDKTMDVLMADGNNSSTYVVFANRVVAEYVDCGDVVSGVLSLGDLEDEEMVVTSAKLTPNLSLNGGSATFYMSNEDPENWQEATVCADDATSYCVSFPKPVGRQVKWKANLCSNSTRTQSPTIAGVGISFDYTPAEEHYRSGVVVNDGVAYVGAFRQPGHRGHFYAVNAGLDTTYWDVAVTLDAMADVDRKLYTSDPEGTELIEFSTSNASELLATLSVATEAQASDIVAWQRGYRFGLGGFTPKTRLGAVETSTPAVLTPPGMPLWYSFSKGSLRNRVDDFMESHEDRPSLVFFGSRDGALHAVRTIPTAIGNPANGVEAWGFIPAKVAFNFAADQAADVARPDYPNGTPIATAYPDGSPALADILIQNEMRTVLIAGSGNGGKGVFALDVTDTIDADGSLKTTDGLAPLWHYVPGDGEAGRALSKPSIARVKMNPNSQGLGQIRFIAILGTGPDPDAPDNGRMVVALDVENGEEMWKFEAKCPLSSNILTFETDDELETSVPDIDGYIDRVVFADSCGNVYKLDPAQDVDGELIDSMGSLTTTVPSGHEVNVLFSVATSSGALGEDRPIAGTLAARPDSSTRMVLFFGTGGVESFDVSKQNEFYAVYADTGEIRDKFSGTCSSGRCEKFYGGVVVTESQVIYTRATDPPIGSDTCEFGNSSVNALAIDGFDDPSCPECFSQSTPSASVSSLYGDRGAVYMATLSGDIVRVGVPKATNAGDDTASGYQPGQLDAGDSSGPPGQGRPLSMLGWRQTL